MQKEEVGRRIVVIISEHRGETETVMGVVTAVIDNNLFEVTDKYGNVSRWNESQIKGIKFKPGVV